MSGSAQHSVRPALSALDIGPVERCQCHTEMIGMAAHLVQRDKAVVAVKGSVLEALGHYRSAVLLHPHREADYRLPAEAATRLGNQVRRQKPVQEIEDARVNFWLAATSVCHRPIYIPPIRFGGLGTAVDIGAVDRKTGD